jgi:hypothetical protein
VPFHGGSNDNIGGRGRLRRLEIVLQKGQTSVINTVYCRSKKFIGGVVDTGGQFLAYVIDTVEQFIAGVNNSTNNIFPRCR